MTSPPPFWKTKPLAAMTREEWESLCDGCGRCCLNKLEDEDTGDFLYTRAACRLLDLKTCRCSDYANRQSIVSDCVALTPENVGTLGWLPRTCAYRLLDEGKPLQWWHPLVSGRKETVDEAGISVKGGDVYSEEGITVDELVDHVWRLPKPKRRKMP
ncbi:YcgN family cysteine cluster protein [Aestuariivirga sp.]|uniref:YcgN family cysteine cluster protein n=1 Tax=Aestuariivirga sp. TaxID=2650926 RepID=UPI003593F6AD